LPNTFIPKALALLATALPIFPKPIIPKVNSHKDLQDIFSHLPFFHIIINERNISYKI